MTSYLILSMNHDMINFDTPSNVVQNISRCDRFLHVEVVVARKVCVQNEFFHFVVLCIEENVLKLDLVKICNAITTGVTIPMVK